MYKKLNLYTLLLFCFTWGVLLSCQPPIDPPVYFTRAFPKMYLDLTQEWGSQHKVITGHNDTLNFTIQYDTPSHLNYFTNSITGETLEVCHASFFRGLYYLSHPYDGYGYHIYAVDFTFDRIIGMCSAKKQMQMLYTKIKEGQFENLVETTGGEKEHPLYRMDYNKRILRHFYKNILDSLPVWKVVYGKDVIVENLPKDDNITLTECFDRSKKANPKSQPIDSLFMDYFTGISGNDTGLMVNVPQNLSKDLEEYINIYPNPAHQKCTVRFAEKGKFKVIVVAFSNAQIVFNQIINDDKVTIPLTSVKAGTYLVLVCDIETGEATEKKLIVE